MTAYHIAHLIIFPQHNSEIWNHVAYMCIKVA